MLERGARVGLSNLIDFIYLSFSRFEHSVQTQLILSDFSICHSWGLSAVCKLYQRWGRQAVWPLTALAPAAPAAALPSYYKSLPATAAHWQIQSALFSCFGLHLWRRQAVWPGFA